MLLHFSMAVSGTLAFTNLKNALPSTRILVHPSSESCVHGICHGQCHTKLMIRIFACNMYESDSEGSKVLKEEDALFIESFLASDSWWEWLGTHRGRFDFRAANSLTSTGTIVGDRWSSRSETAEAIRTTNATVNDFHYWRRRWQGLWTLCWATCMGIATTSKQLALDRARNWIWSFGRLKTV